MAMETSTGSGSLQLIVGQRSFWIRFAPVVALCVIILLMAAIRWRLRQMPLERDEGEYAYVGQLILQGIPPYQIAYNMKLPGTYAAYAVVMGVLGQNPASIRLGLLAANTLTILLVYVLGKRLYGTVGGVVAAASYGLLSAGPWVYGFAAHATHFVVLAALAGLWVLLVSIDRQSTWALFFAGFLLGLAFIMKQPGVVYGLFAALYLLKNADGSRGRLQPAVRLAWFAAGAILPFATVCLILWRAGVFAKFWFWTFVYAFQYGTSLKLTNSWTFFAENFSKLVLSAVGMWLLAGVGLSSLFWNRKARVHAGFLLGLLFFSSLGVSVGLHFRGHYFILLLPAVSLLIGSAVGAAAWPDAGERSRPMRNISVAVFVAAFVLALVEQEFFLFRADPISASRYVYPEDPFAEAAEVGRYIEHHSLPSDRVAVLGSEPEIMFYAHRRSATGYLYTYALTEPQKYARSMEQEFISEIEAARPKFLVFVEDWQIEPESYKDVFVWSRQYLAENYDFVGAMRVNDALQFRSGAEIAETHEELTGVSYLFRRKGPVPVATSTGK